MKNHNGKIFLKVICTILGVLFFSITTDCNSNDKAAPESSEQKVIKSLDACAVFILEDAMEAFGEKMQQKEGFPRNVELHGGKVLISSCSYYSQTSKKSLSLNITVPFQNFLNQSMSLLKNIVEKWMSQKKNICRQHNQLME